MSCHNADITVLNGLPVTVQFSISGPDYSVGINHSEIDEWEITHINGKRCKKAPVWLYNRIDNTKGEDERILDKLYNTADDIRERDWDKNAEEN